MRGRIVESFGAGLRRDSSNSRVDASWVSPRAIVPRGALGAALGQCVVIAIETWLTLLAIILVVQVLVRANPTSIRLVM